MGLLQRSKVLSEQLEGFGDGGHGAGGHAYLRPEAVQCVEEVLGTQGCCHSLHQGGQTLPQVFILNRLGGGGGQGSS